MSKYLIKIALRILERKKGEKKGEKEKSEEKGRCFTFCDFGSSYPADNICKLALSCVCVPKQFSLQIQQGIHTASTIIFY